ncbi:MAG TPA: hypothetical protein VHB68_17390, partial [Steroidobacteraceae bacterium]|nr:hypothetical protein [Steroidobacteraceae bacterium]
MLRETALKLTRAGGVALLCLFAAQGALADEPGDVPAPDAAGTPIPKPSPEQVAHWYDLSRLPFLPVPEVGSDPNGGTTVGILPVWLHSDENHEITRIVAPDLTHNPYFGLGAHARMYSYPSEDEQWSVVAGIKQRVERGVDAEYQLGRLREGKFTSTTNVDWDRDGTPRFFGVGNNSLYSAQTNYTSQTTLIQEQLGWNLTHNWQLLYTIRKRIVDVLPGTLSSVPSIETLFPNVRGRGTSSELLNRY